MEKCHKSRRSENTELAAVQAIAVAIVVIVTAKELVVCTAQAAGIESAHFVPLAEGSTRTAPAARELYSKMYSQRMVTKTHSLKALLPLRKALADV